MVRCQVCDVLAYFPTHILASMKLPSVFCMRCYTTYDFLTLRQWYKLDRLATALYSPPRA